MRSAALTCIVLAIAVMASPLRAQQAPPPEVPPASEPPPPFPYYPPAKPREHNPNYRKATHAHGKTHHATKAHRGPGHRVKSHHAAPQKHFSKRTIRQCHRMTYKQIMRYPNCRIMMKQDLQAAEHRAHRHSSAHRQKARHHRAHHRR